MYEQPLFQPSGFFLKKKQPMLKRDFLPVLFAVLLPSLALCQTKKVVATASIFADMAENIAGGHVEVKTIVPIGGDPHTYEPTPADAKLVADADLILRNGLTFEGWLNDLIANAGSKAQIVTITEGIQPIRAVYKNSSDPHAWMDASNGLVYIENIKNALVTLDPANKQTYEFNYGVYKSQLEELDRYIFRELAKIPQEKRILITSHDAFQYYGRRYGIRLESVIGVSTEAQAQTSDIIRLNKVIRESRVPAVFIETTVNPKLLEQIAKDNQVAIGGKLFSDSIGDKDSPAPSYYDMLKYNTDLIVEALSKEGMPTGAIESSPEKKGDWLLWTVIALVLAGGFLIVWKKLNANHV
jgi:ABC-type Zn uptake system ZnuABC Zn-binding protein ZnuA